MQVLIALFAIFAFANCAHQFYYAGTTNSSDGGTSPTAPYAIVTAGVCTAGTASGYQKFTINATAISFYYITAMWQDPTVDHGQIQVYSAAFDPVNPCTNLKFEEAASSGGPHAAILDYVTVGLYDVVITTNDAAYAGVFAVHADRSDWVGGTTSDGSNYWNAPDGGQSYCTTSGYYTPYTSHTFTVVVSGYYDVIVYGFNSTDTTVDIIAALYNETHPAFIGTGNFTNPANPCPAGNTFVWSEDDSSTYTKVNQNNYGTAYFSNVWLTLGVNYTMVMSSSYEYENYFFGTWVRPTVTGRLQYDGFLRPDLSSFPCSPSTSSYKYTPVVFTATFSTYVMDNGYGDFDTAACLYSGMNVGTAVVPPAPCPVNWLQCIDTGDIGPLHQLGTTIGANYTIVQTTYSSGGGSIGAEYNLYIYTGVQLGPLPVTTTGVATSGEGSSASAVVASIAVIIAAMLF